MTQAVVYARFSPRPNGQECESNEVQAEACRAYCKRQGWEVAEVFGDRELSGKSAKRPGLWESIEALGKGGKLVVFKLDRLARDVYLSHIIEQSVAKRGGTIVSVAGEGTWNDTPSDKLIRRILQALAEHDREVTSIRTSIAMRHHQKNGRRMSRPDQPPIGMMADPENSKRLVPNPEEVALLARVRELQEKKYTVGHIAKMMTAEGSQFRGKRWSGKKVWWLIMRMKKERTPPPRE